MRQKSLTVGLDGTVMFVELLTHVVEQQTIVVSELMAEAVLIDVDQIFYQTEE